MLNVFIRAFIVCIITALLAVVPTTLTVYALITGILTFSASWTDVPLALLYLAFSVLGGIGSVKATRLVNDGKVQDKIHSYITKGERPW